MSLPTPTRILQEPFRRRVGRKRVFMLATDVGILELKEVAERISLSRSALWHRLFNAQNTSWQDENIFDQCIPKTKTERIEEPAQPLPSKKARRDPLSLSLGTWERRDRVWSKFLREQTINGLPQRDADYRDALKFNRAVAR